MQAPRHDTRGIVQPSGLLTRVRFRRHEPAEPLRRYVEWYWLIDWDLPEPYASHIVPHPSVNLTFQWDEAEGPPYAEVHGVALGLFTRKPAPLFSTYVGVSPKWCILRYRIHEALDRAGTDADWAALANELGTPTRPTWSGTSRRR